MTLRPEFALGHSEYNAFLFASVGEEASGEEERRPQLTVLTALTRLGLDPWQEAARLSGLPREVAAQALAVMIAALPEGNWKTSESGAIAARLVNWLPGRSVPPAPSVGGSVRETGSLKAGRWLVWGAVFVAVLCTTLYLQPDNNLEPASGASVSTQK